MDQRKLIRLGNSSYAIALPKDWIDKSGLKKGDNVFITPNSNGELIVQPTYKKPDEEPAITLNLNNKKERDIHREIIAAYIKGHNLINVKIDKKDLNSAKDSIKNLFGIEIIDATQDSIVARSIIDITSVTIENITRRLDNSLRNIIEELSLYIKKGNLTNKEYNEILSARKDVNRFYFLLCKIMIQGMENPSVLNAIKTNSFSVVCSWAISSCIKQIGDSLKEIAKILSKNKINEKEAEHISKILNKIKENFVLALTSYHLKDSELSLKATKTREEIFDLCSKENKSLAAREVCNNFIKIQHDIHYIARYVMDFVKSDDSKEK